MARTGQDVFEILSTEQGLSSSVVTCILKDQKGFMWFGTQNGLNRYDGYNFTQYYSDTLSHSISGNYIRAIYEDSFGNLWIGTERHGLNRYDRKMDRFYRIRMEEYPSQNVTISAIIQLDENRLLIGMNEGLATFNIKDEKIELFPVMSGDKKIENFTVEVFFIDDSGLTWIGTDKGLFRLEPGKQEAAVFRVEPENLLSISNNNINEIYRTKNGKLLIGTNEGLNVFNDKTGHFKQLNLKTGNLENAELNEIHALAEDKRGNLWIGTFGGGLLKGKIDDDHFLVFKNIPNDPESLSNDYIYSMFFDPTGVLWVGTYGGGINKLEMLNISFSGLWRNEKSLNTLAGNEVFSILPVGRELWIGTDNGLSIYDQDKKTYTNIREVQADPKSLSDNTIYCLLQDQKRNIWLGTAAGGLNKLEADKRDKNQYSFIRFNTEQDQTRKLMRDEILCLFEDGSGKIWVGTRNGLNLINEDSVIQDFDSKSFFNNGEIYVITTDPSGKIWIGTTEGLYKFDISSNTFIHFNDQQLHDNSGNRITIYSIYADAKGTLWIGTDNAGLIRMDANNGEVLANYNKANGLPDNVIYGTLEDQENNLWLSSNNGIIKAIRHEGSNRLSFVSFNSKNHLPTEAFNIGAYASDENGNLYFGSFEGVTYFHPDNVAGNKNKPPVVITRFQLFFKDVPISENGTSPLSQHISETPKLELKHNQSVLKFEFAALNYLEPDKNRYAFKMEKLDNDWNFSDDQRQAQYLYIPPGEYTFRVKASNNDGLWNEEGTAIDIVIKPPFTQTIWFFLIVFVVLVLVIYWILNVRTRRLKAIRDRLEKQVQKRTKELREKNDALNTALNDLKKTQSQLIDSEKMASLGQLTAGVAHEINNPINFVSGNVSPLRKDINEVLEVLKKYDEVIGKNKLEKLFREVESLKEQMDYTFVLEEINKLLDGIGEGAARTAEIVKGLRNFSRMDEHELKLADINQGIESTLLILHNKLKRRIEVVKDYGKIPEVMCYPGQLNQVFMNIINNGLEAIEGEGKIFIRTWHEKEKVFISIRDSGAGMSESVKRRIFEPFFTTKEVGKGTGLGLSISFGIIERHSGKILVNTEKGKGSEFIIELPITQL
jgi:signal transduction histidine kinase/ligand-binding sensor domain-containing protein